MKWAILLPLIALICISCTNSNKRSQVSSSIIKNSYAKGFTISKIGEDNYEVVISNPWQEATNINYHYNLVKADSKIIKENDIIYPVEKVMCLSTTHIAFIENLNEIDKVIGVSNPQFLYSKIVTDKYKKGIISDIGFDQSLNYEIIVNQQPDIVFIYGVGGENSSFYNKLNQLGIKTIFIGEYLEENPLAKLEWIKLFGLMFNKQQEAIEQFKMIEEEYNFLLSNIPEIKIDQNKPKVMFNLPWDGTWYVPGGNSYLANMVKLCNGKYIWEENQSRSTIPLSIESVLLKGSKADIWLNPGNANTKKEILLEDQRLKNFEPFLNSQIYNFNKRLNENGGNDYWESGVVNPHLILKDLITILHPEIFPDYEFYYCKEVE
jgi:cobalamin transport system substrate-binding protein